MDVSWFTPIPYSTKRYETFPVSVGSIYIGSSFPVKIQSMANTKTSHINDSVNQAIEIINAGAELVRFTVTNEQDAESLKYIREKLHSLGYSTPLVADVHFNPSLADITAQYVEKVRINPGNYLDKRASFKKVLFSDEEYAQELKKLEDRFTSFITICKLYHTAIRIGTNHGSLSDRIMSRYGDTPEGMVEATMEFLRLCKKQDFTNVVVSLKSSNTRVMVYAYRLLAKHMSDEKMQFALHLGVTEAGNAGEGRIKSAVGIGTLMHDGLGDTIRVSLTENPVNEIPVGKLLIDYFKNLENQPVLKENRPCYNPYSYNKRDSYKIGVVGGKQLPVVVTQIPDYTTITKETFLNLGFTFDNSEQTFRRSDLSPDVIYVGVSPVSDSLKSDAVLICDYSVWHLNSPCFPLFSWNEYIKTKQKSSIQNWVSLTLKDIDQGDIDLLKKDKSAILLLKSENSGIQDLRILINRLMEKNIENPIIINKFYSNKNITDFQILSAADFGLFFIDGLSDGLWLHAEEISSSIISETSFGILQASRSRTTKTEYISCPSCGRTLFDIETSLSNVKQATQHLKGMKIAVMGCIVNGPGEMADADYGYVGAGPDKVSIYKGKTLVLKNIDANLAVDELMKIIDSEKRE